MAFEIYPIFEDLFPGSRRPDLADILSETSSAAMLRAASFLNHHADALEGKPDRQEEVFVRWISIFDNEIKSNIWINYSIFKNRVISTGDIAVLFSSKSVLYLLDSICRNFNDIPEQEKKSISDEIALLKAWLICNSISNLIAEDAIKDIAYTRDGSTNSEDALKAMLVNEADQYEFIGQKDIIYQALLANDFFNFMKENVETSPHYYNFLERKKVKSHNEYLRNVILTCVDGYNNKTFGFGLGEKEDSLSDFFNSISIDISISVDDIRTNFKEYDPDHRRFREYPLVRGMKGEYYPLYNNFLIDKIYQGLIFDFYKHSTIREIFKTLPDFLNFLGNFAESILFHNHIDKCFPLRKWIVRRRGDRTSSIEYSDFYLRDGNTVFLFEFKNSLINSSVKHSRDFPKIKEEIFKKMVNNEKGKKKGITQLLSVVHQTVSIGFEFDKQISKAGRLNVFPIIVYTDDFFSLIGVQYLIREEFQRIVTGSPLKRHRVNDIIMIHLKDIIDIKYQVTLGKTSFKNIISEYKERRKGKLRKKDRSIDDVIDKYVSFRILMRDQIQSYSDRQEIANQLKNILSEDIDVGE